MAPKTKPKDADVDPPPKGDDGDDVGDDDGDDDGDDGNITRGELREMVAEIVAEVVKPAEGKKNDDGGGKPPGRSTARDDEADMRARVEAEVARIRKDDEVLGKIAKIEEAIKPKEEPPRKPRFLERLLWDR